MDISIHGLRQVCALTHDGIGKGKLSWSFKRLPSFVGLTGSRYQASNYDAGDVEFEASARALSKCCHGVAHRDHRSILHLSSVLLSFSWMTRAHARMMSEEEGHDTKHIHGQSMSPENQVRADLFPTSKQLHLYHIVPPYVVIMLYNHLARSKSIW